MKDLLLCILEKDPNKRTTLKEIMNHDWVTCQGTLERLQSSYHPFIFLLCKYIFYNIK